MREKNGSAGFLRDLRLAARRLAGAPSFTLVAVLTLGLGIGANAALFSVVNGLLFRPLPVQGADRLVVLATQPERQPVTAWLSYPEFLDLRREGPFADLLGHVADFTGFAVDDRAERVLVSYVTGNYFSMLGLRPHAGRLILPGEGRVAGADQVVVLAHDFWRTRFDGDLSVVGKTALLGGRRALIVGIAPAGFKGLITGIREDAYMPLGMAPHFPEWQDRREARRIRGLGRLRPDTNLARARAAVAVISSRLARQYPESNRGVAVRLFPESLARPEPELVALWPPVIAIFMSLVGLVLLVACFNVANLLLVRATLTRGETAVRLSLGASRAQLLRHSLAESLLLALLGGAAGLLLAAVSARILQSLPLGGDPPVQLDLGLDGRVLSYVAALVLGSCLIFGLVPALLSTRQNRLSEMLYEQGRTAAGGGRHGLRKALVALQIAVSLPLLATAGLFVRSFDQARSIDLGFRAKDLLVVGVDTDLQAYDEPRREAFFRRLREGAAALPGVRSAALAFSVPMGQYDLTSPVAADGKLPAPDAWPFSNYNTIDARYFETLGIPILRGRGFTEADMVSSAKVAVVNQTLADRLWNADSPLGERLVLGPEGPAFEVVGVAKNGKYGFLFEPPQPFFYIPLAQEPHSLRVLHLASLARTEALAGEVRRILHDLDPAMPALGLWNLDARLHEDVNGFQLPRLGAWLTASLALVGLLLSSIGLYAVMSFITGRRRHEIGIRLALGAERASILSMVIRQGLVLVTLGLVPGLALSYFAARFIATMLYGVQPNDPWTLAGVILLLMAIGFLACLLPARRASRSHPMAALRVE